MISLREYVIELSNDQRIQILKDYVLFEHDAMIGDCLLRQHATMYCVNYLPHTHFDARIMDRLANAIYRFYAEFYLNSVGDLINGT